LDVSPTLAPLLLRIETKQTSEGINSATYATRKPLACKLEALHSRSIPCSWFSPGRLLERAGVTNFERPRLGLLLTYGIPVLARTVSAQENPASLVDLLDAKVSGASRYEQSGLSIARVIPWRPIGLRRFRTPPGGRVPR